MLNKAALLILLIITYKCQQAPNPSAVMSGTDSSVNINPSNANLANNYSVCTQPKYQGPCRSSMPRYYYDTDQKKCLSFTYGGCNPNGNNFETITKCNETCNVLARS
ncbi:PI-stichotoxin-Hcr2n-like [Chironomus tepperi]|uniref:PI-stichotoxin-Hcr2n-like n=1 Tax=Chironomus tepperi TaxID=113505 RepID=UPI00391F4E76